MAVKDIVHVHVHVKPDIDLTAAKGLTVGDWVEAQNDFSPGRNSRCRHHSGDNGQFVSCAIHLGQSSCGEVASYR